MRYKFLSVLVLGLVIQLSAFAQTVTRIGDINGVSVTKEELQREMKKYRAEVYNSLAKDASNKGNFWTTETRGGKKPIDILRNKALDSLTAIKVQERLLTERKLWPYKGYQDFLKDLNSTNAQRKKAVEDKKVVYGPTEYSEEIFYSYRLTNALIPLKHKLVEEKLITVTESDLKSQFEKMQKTVYQEEKFKFEAFTRQVREAYIEEAYAKLIKKLAQSAKQNIQKDHFRQILLTN